MSNNDEPALFTARQTKPAPSALVAKTATDNVITPKTTIRVEYLTTKYVYNLHIMFYTYFHIMRIQKQGVK